jgi:hypothetical protein
MEPNSAKTYTGRWVAGVSVALGLIAAVIPVAMNMDVSSTAGIVAGIVAICTVAVKFLDGTQRYEERLDAVAATPPATETPAPPPTGDELDEDDGDNVVPLHTPIDSAELADVPNPPSDDEIGAATDEAIAADVMADEDLDKAA